MRTNIADSRSAVHGRGVSAAAAAAGYGGASDDEGGARDAWGAMQAADDTEDGSLLSAPRKVPNMGIAYARSSKQVCSACVEQSWAHRYPASSNGSCRLSIHLMHHTLVSRALLLAASFDKQVKRDCRCIVRWMCGG